MANLTQPLEYPTANVGLGGWADMPPPGNPLGGYAGLARVPMPPIYVPSVAQPSTINWKLAIIAMAIFWAVTKHR